MFFPKLHPSQIVGQSLDIAGQFIGVAMVSIGDAIFSGPLFRDGNRVFMLHSEQQPDGVSVSLRFVDIGERATSTVIDQKAQIDALVERITSDRDVIADLRTSLKSYVTDQGTKDRVIVEYQQAVARLQNENADLATRLASLDLSLTGINAERIEVQNALAIAEGMIQKYIDLVGPLDAPGRTINDDIADQLKLDGMEQPPPPPPVVPEKLGMSTLYGKVEPGPAAYDAPGLADETIVREGSSVDNSFRRLMFLTRGE